MMRVVLAAGGTAGHISPAIAVAQALRELDPDAAILFAGARAGIESHMVSRAGFEPAAVGAAPWQRQPGTARLRGALATARGVVSAMRLLRRVRPHVVVGFGGYGSVPAVLAATLLRIPVALVEPNVKFGLANRFLARSADTLFAAAWTEVPADLSSKVIHCGIPVRREFAASRRPDPPYSVLVLGDAALDGHASRMLEELGGTMDVLVTHQSQAASPEVIRRMYGDAAPRVHELIDDVAAAFAASDLVIARAGASTLAELATAARPAILVPLPDAAEDHQTFNATAYAAEGAAVVVSEHSWTTTNVAGIAADILRDDARWQSMSAAAARHASGAAMDIARWITKRQ